MPFRNFVIWISLDYDNEMKMDIIVRNVEWVITNNLFMSRKFTAFNEHLKNSATPGIQTQDFACGVGYYVYVTK